MPLSRSALALVALAGVVVGAGATLGYDRLRPGGAVGPQVRAYLLAHPEVITEAMTRLGDREQGKLVAQHRDAIVRPYAGAWAGNPDGDVTLVEYFDYNCGYCRASLPVLQTLLQRDPKLKLVYRELPILADTSRRAAQVSLAAAQTGPDAYRRFHAALYEGGPISDATIAAAARTAGVDVGRVPVDAEAEVKRNMEVAGALNFSGTPTWVVGNRVLAGAQTLDGLEEAVRAARGG